MKLRIVNRKKFILNMSIFIGLLLFILLGDHVFSKTTDKYTTILVSSGDTLWSIAKEEQKNNPYYENRDIRYIVNDIKNINNLKDGNITNNQKLNIPTI